MSTNQPLQLSSFLPKGVAVDDVYVLLATLAVVFCVVAFSGGFSSQNGQMNARIRAIAERRRELRGELVGPKKRRSPEKSISFMRTVATKLQLIKKNQIGKTEDELIQAGLRSKDAIFVLAFFNLVLPIILCAIGIVIMKMNEGSHSKWATLNYAWPMLGAYIGLKLPWMYIAHKRKKRYLQIQRSLSDVLDLMTISAEAGLSLAAMLDRVSRELHIAYPEMAEELSLTSIEIGFLPDRNKALYNLAERCKLPEVRGITSVLIQTEKYGTPIAQALRVLSSEFRQARMLRAEQKAAKLPALMTVPMIIFILPTLFIVIIAPAAVKLMDTFAH
ncbi:MAG: type II secretion system F family protein [Alphaproteobacteria bacterium]|nr:type II secretion system F family protein [Alphaproteobacteria bacterium]